MKTTTRFEYRMSTPYGTSRHLGNEIVGRVEPPLPLRSISPKGEKTLIRQMNCIWLLSIFPPLGGN